MRIRLKRAYDAPATGDGVRILVERLWPRGLSKDEARLDHWARDVAPSPALRKWYGHDPDRWPEFRRRYRAELEANPEALVALRAQMHGRIVTFVFGSKDTERNSAVVLREFLQR